MALMKMQTDDDGRGSSVEFEVDDEVDGVEFLGPDGSGPAEAPFTLAASLDRAMPALSLIMSKLRTAAAGAEEVTAELGLSIGGETGLFFAKGSADATVKVTVTWRGAPGGR